MDYILLISGGRDFTDVEYMIMVLNWLKERLETQHKLVKVVTGGARGADEIGELWAKEVGIPVVTYPVTDNDWKRLGRKAGVLRNQEMLDKENPDGVICFPGGKGTADMQRRASQIPWVDVWWMEKILFRKEDPDTYFCSNFAQGFDFADPETGEWWATSEHYYQAQKTPIESERSTIQNASTPLEAKNLGANVNIYQDWDERKIDAMRRAIKLKFYPGSKAAEKLIDTGWDYLIEFAPWGDTFWGVDKDQRGENWLGKLLMERRNELRDD